MPAAGSPERARETIARGAQDIAPGVRLVVPADLLAEAWPGAADVVAELRQLVGAGLTVEPHALGAVIIRPHGATR